MSRLLTLAAFASLMCVCCGALAQSAGKALNTLRQGNPEAKGAVKEQIAAYVESAWCEDVLNRLAGAPRRACIADDYKSMDRKLARRIGLKVFYAQTTDERKQVLGREAMVDVLGKGLRELYPCNDKGSR